MVCIQSLEGYLTIVDGGHILCNRQFAWTPLLPGILKYCKTADAIITHSSDYCLEAYKISDLVKTNASDASGSIQKHIEGKLQPSWSIILGEKIIDILVGKFAFSNEDHGSEIVIVGTHTLFAFTDTGIPTYQTLLDFIPMLCTSYTSNKLEFSPSPLQHLVIISKTFQIYIFKELKVAWIAQGPRSMSHLTTGSFSDVQGYLVYLESENPTISAISLIQFKYCSSSAQSQQISEIQRKLNQVQNVINQEITPTFEMKKEILSISSSFKIDESAHSLFDTIPDHKICAYFTISLQNRATFDLNELSMSILVPSGITISHSHFSIAVLKDKAEFVSSIHASLPIASETIKILVSFKLRNNTTTRVTMMEVDIPNEIFNIYEANTHLDNGQNILKQLDIVTNKASMTLQQLYSNISLSDLDVPCSSINFKMVSSGKKCGGQNVKVTASKSSGKYCLQSNLAGLLLLPFKDLAECLKRHSW
ncbi:PTHB1 N-terminus-domain-containing protein [Chytriomyces sp. MP71]|nr:PTHB1 N-terminus-domain-containing protein [Chytriomyces sp. MP71]